MWTSLPETGTPIPPLVDEPESNTDENNPEIRKQINTYATSSQKTPGLGSKRFSRFSKWSTFQRAIANLTTIAKRCRAKPDPQPPQRVQETVESKSNLPIQDTTKHSKILSYKRFKWKLSHPKSTCWRRGIVTSLRIGNC